VYWFGVRARTSVDDHAVGVALSSPRSALTVPWREGRAELDPEPAVLREPAPLEAAPVAAEPDAKPAGGDPASAWERETDGLRPAELRELAEEEEQALRGFVLDALQKRTEAGIYEVIGSGTRHRITREEKAEMEDQFISFGLPPESDPPGEQRKTVLPKNEYPELYEQKARIAWLRGEAVLRTPK